MIFSCIIPASAKDAESKMLKDLIASIKAQDFPQYQIEILVITEGDSEQAKAIGIKRAKGEICAMFCADNMIVENDLFKRVKLAIDNGYSAVYPAYYARLKHDNSLNRYFSLIGGNDPICYYLGKNDRLPHVLSLEVESDYPKSYGCNGFFYKAESIKKTNLDNYYPMDNALEVSKPFMPLYSYGIWHRTSDNLVTFLKKRYRYARDLYCDRRNRRWKIIDTNEDKQRLIWFIISTLIIFPCLWISIKGYSKIKDIAWFWHWPVCLGFLITYGCLSLRNLIKHGRLFQCPSKPVSSFQPSVEVKA